MNLNLKIHNLDGVQVGISETSIAGYIMRYLLTVPF